LEKYVKNPTVEIRMLNFHVSVLGEVSSPGIYTFPDERFTILEALTMAGGFKKQQLLQIPSPASLVWLED